MRLAPRPLALGSLLLALALAGCATSEPEESAPEGDDDAAANTTPDRGGIGEGGIDANAPPEAPLGADADASERADDAPGDAQT